MNMLMAIAPETVPDGCPLTAREFEVLQLLANGKRYTQISYQLHCAPSTVRQHCHNAYLKLGVTDRVGAVLHALNAGWITANGHDHASTNGYGTLADDLASIDDRGIKFAEGLVHERRQENERHGFQDPMIDRSLQALDAVRRITKR